MKKFLLILLTIIILLAGGICGLYLNLESIVKAAAAKPAADQTDATRAGTAKPAVSSGGSAKSASSSGGKKVIINALNITGGKVSLGATFGGKGAAASVPLPAVTLKDIGREKGSQGKGIIETASLILKKILDTAYDTAVRQGLNSLKDIAGESADTLKGTAENLKNSAKGLLGGLL